MKYPIPSTFAEDIKITGQINYSKYQENPPQICNIFVRIFPKNIALTLDMFIN